MCSSDLSVAAYAILIAAVGDLNALLFGEFAFMWAHVSLAGVGLVNAYEWGYEDDPGGAAARPTLTERVKVTTG